MVRCCRAIDAQASANRASCGAECSASSAEWSARTRAWWRRCGRHLRGERQQGWPTPVAIDLAEEKHDNRDDGIRPGREDMTVTTKPRLTSSASGPARLELAHGEARAGPRAGAVHEMHARSSRWWTRGRKAVTREETPTRRSYHEHMARRSGRPVRSKMARRGAPPTSRSRAVEYEKQMSLAQSAAGLQSCAPPTPAELEQELQELADIMGDRSLAVRRRKEASARAAVPLPVGAGGRDPRSADSVVRRGEFQRCWCRPSHAATTPTATTWDRHCASRSCRSARTSAPRRPSDCGR